MKTNKRLVFWGILMKLNRVNILLLSIFIFSSCGQENINWQHLDLKDDGVFGISTNKAYKELLKGKKSTTVIVAVMDAGLDPNHEDLKSSIWVNEKEIPDNQIDDDNNGYTDDVHGWNFSDAKEGVQYNGNVILTCLVIRDQARFDQVKYADLPLSERGDYENYQKNKNKLEQKKNESENNLAQIKKFKMHYDAMVKHIGKDRTTLNDFISYSPQHTEENQARSYLLTQMKRKTFEEFYQEDILDQIEKLQDNIDYSYNIDYRPPLLLEDNSDSSSPFTGNNDIKAIKSEHGSHVAGIIGADRNNKLGIQGIADNVRIMPLLPFSADGRQLERVWAQAIRYAVDNGAKVINMSFRELNTWDRRALDAAIKYAVSKDVLLIHAAGNESANLDEEPNFPNPFLLDGSKAPTWITVGASDKDNNEALRASFSNYGKIQVDVFAPGVRINSTVSGSKYKRLDGTSMAAPVVAGLAALIRSYYPALSALQVKEIIMKSVTKVDQLKERCVSGGVVNAYTALQLAEEYNNKQ